MTVSATEVSVKRELTVWLISSLCSKFHWSGKSFFFKREPTTSGFVAQFKMKKKKNEKPFGPCVRTFLKQERSISVVTTASNIFCITLQTNELILLSQINLKQKVSISVITSSSNIFCVMQQTKELILLSQITYLNNNCHEK